MEYTIDCPSCKALCRPIFIADLLEQDYPEPKESYSMEACGFKLRIRPLTVADQEKLLVDGTDSRQGSVARKGMHTAVTACAA